MTIAIIGSGRMGSTLARLAVNNGERVRIANSRGAASLQDLVTELGPLAEAADTVNEAIADAEIVLLAITLPGLLSLPRDLFDKRTVIDTSNYYPGMLGRTTELDESGLSTSEFVQDHFRDARIVKAFSNILFHHIPQLSRPHDSGERSTLPIAGDDPDAKRTAAELIDRLGFDTLDVGGMDQSWRFEPEIAAYTQIYLADPDNIRDFMTDPAGPTDRATVEQALAASQRVAPAQRQF